MQLKRTIFADWIYVKHAVTEERNGYALWHWNSDKDEGGDTIGWQFVTMYTGYRARELAIQAIFEENDPTDIQSLL